jgi:hypothetical protein
MLQLLEPIWLVAMSGIVVPIAVHLWNDRRGRVLRIGSVALLEGASKRMAWRRRISQWWLLVLRCLLLLALAFLLAGPYWQRRPRGKGWVLADGDGLGVSAAGGPYRGMIDSLVKAGYEKHLLSDTLNYWAGFRVADRKAPAGLAFYVFTPGLVSRFSGTRPETSREVHWNTYALKDPVETWVQRRWKIGKDSMVVLSGVSRATGTSWERRTSTLSGPVDTTVLRYRAYGEDAKYVAAAMKALARVTGRPIAEGDRGWLFSGKYIDSLGWREQVWDGRLPVLLGRLLPEDTPRHDRRMIDPRQVAPTFREGGPATVALEEVDLRPMVWGLVFLLFVLERMIAFNEKA